MTTRNTFLLLSVFFVLLTLTDRGPIASIAAENPKYSNNNYQQIDRGYLQTNNQNNNQNKNNNQNNNNNNNNVTECYACPAGRTASGCTGCGSGSCSNIDDCAYCAPGTFNSQIGGQCLRCLAGYVADKIGSVYCRACPRGYSSSDDNTQCQQCSPGQYNPSVGSVCYDCPLGSATVEYSSWSCMACQAGSYADQLGSIHCIACGQGYYNPAVGSTNASACLECPSGTFCPFVTTSQPRRCPSGYYCKQRTKEPIPCPTLQTSAQGSSSCQFSDTFYVIIGLGCGVALILIVSLAFICHRRLKARQPFDETTDSKQLLRNTSPVYGGY